MKSSKVLRGSVVAMAAAMAALTVAACEPTPPPPPPPTFQVNSYDADGDAAPGDGVCSTTIGGDECTITAAVQEGNALGRAVIDFPLHTDRYLEHPLDVTTISGDITLRSGFMYGNGALSAAATHLTVASGGGLRLEGFTLLVRDDFKIEGTLVVDRATLAASVDIASGGLMLATNALFVGYDGTPSDVLINNEGVAWMRFSELWWSSGPLVHTAASATTMIGASYLMGREVDACTGIPIISEGYNFDRTGFHDWDEVTGSCTGDSRPRPGYYDDLQDVVPLGVLGCGTSLVVDNLGVQRPIDDDGDGVGMCGMGARESEGYFG